MDITLNSESERIISEQLSAGKYVDAQAVVAAALELLDEQARMDSAELEELRQEIAVGLEQIERGEVGPWDVEEIKREGRKLLAAKRKAV